MIHYLVSRFNINHLHYVSHDLNRALSTDWLNYRIDLFYRYTYPTISKQSNMNFRWLVLFDYRTNKDIIDKFIKADTFKICSILLVGDLNYINVLKEYMFNNLNSTTNHILSTTLDTDDGVFPDFIDTIQLVYSESSSEVPFGINFNKGYIVDVLTGMFYAKSFYSNPYYTLVENVDELETVCCLPHHLLSKKFFTINLNKRRYWIQNIHSSNFGNYLKGVPLVFRIGVLNDLKDLYVSPNVASILFSLYLFLSNKVRNFLIKSNKAIKR